MPYLKTEDIPENIRTIDGVSVSLEQANWIAKIADGLKGNPSVKEPWAVAINRFKEFHEKGDNGWTKKVSDNATGEHIGVSLNASQYSLSDAEKFVSEHNLGNVVPVERDGTILFYKKKDSGLDTKTIEHVEIFRSGKWTDSRGKTVEYTDDDIKKMAEDYNHFERVGSIEAPVKLGHDPEQSMLKTDGLPSVGWLKNLVADGGKLFADFVKVPKMVYDAIKAEAYKKRSAEIIHDFKCEETGLASKHLIAGVALLGATLPAISGLSDIAKLYGSKNIPETASLYSFREGESEYKKQERGDKHMEEKLRKQIDELEGTISTLKKKIDDMESEFKAKLEASAAESDEFKKKLEAAETESKEKEKKIEEFKASEVKRDEENFKRQYAKKVAPDEMAATILPRFRMLKSAAATGEEAAGKELSEFTAWLDKREDDPRLSEYGKEGGGERAENDDPEVEIAEYCKKHGLDINKASDYSTAAIKVLEYVRPPDVKRDNEKGGE